MWEYNWLIPSPYVTSDHRVVRFGLDAPYLEGTRQRQHFVPSGSVYSHPVDDLNPQRIGGDHLHTQVISALMKMQIIEIFRSQPGGKDQLIAITINQKVPLIKTRRR